MTQYTRGGVAGPASSLEYHTGTWRVERPIHVHRAAPCHHACPAGEDAQAYLAEVEQGRNRQAWEILVSANPLPALTGRVCPHPCESACNRGQYDEAIAIHNVERFLGDEAIRQGWDYPLQPPAADAPEVAVVGAGPSGLACAWHLLRCGYRVSLFEAEAQAGGTCASAIPTYRLPREVMNAEIERLLALPGIDFKPRQRLGREFSLEDLRETYAAVYLGIGAMQSKPWSIDGVTPSDLHEGLALLQEWLDVGTIPTPESAAVIGGGNTAVDLSRVLKRAGVGQVYIITHNGLPGPEVPVEDAMRALPREIEQASEEGVEILAHRGVRRLILRGEKVVGVEMVHMKKLPDEQGRLHRIAFEGTETVLHVDMVIPA
ncbi:MAG: FAD-dependent oxidoreductase, partial [Gammaproteobacteria bacterium]